MSEGKDSERELSDEEKQIKMTKGLAKALGIGIKNRDQFEEMAKDMQKRKEERDKATDNK